LHVVLAHQHFGHFVDHPKLKKSIFTNARLRAVFGGLDFPDASDIANEMFLADLNTRQIKKAYYHTIHLYKEETRITRSSATGRSLSSGHGISETDSFSMAYDGLDSLNGTHSISCTIGKNMNHAYSDTESSGETEFPVWVPISTQELATESEWSLEEKRSKVAEMLKCQLQRHCFIKLDVGMPCSIRIPEINTVPITQDEFNEYKTAIYRAQEALSIKDVDALLKESEASLYKRLVISGEATERPTLSSGLTGSKRTVASPNPFDELLGRDA